jgi:SAM-dependent methyltransferase
MTEANQSSSVRTDFEYSYFDDPDATGYQGYQKDHNGDDNYLPWQGSKEFCVANGVTSASDWGCAKGYLVEELIAAGIDAVGYDVSEYAVGIAKENGLPCSIRDLRDAGNSDRKADATFVLGALMYVEEDELPGVLAGLEKETNQFLLISVFWEGLPQDLVDVWRRITRPRAWWREQIEAAGFHYEGENSLFDIYRT